jgi:hypothetical protein
LGGLEQTVDVGGAACGEQVRGIAMLRRLGPLDEADRCRDPGHALGHGAHVIGTGLVGVRPQDDVVPPESLQDGDTRGTRRASHCPHTAEACPKQGDGGWLSFRHDHRAAGVPSIELLAGEQR